MTLPPLRTSVPWLLAAFFALLSGMMSFRYMDAKTQASLHRETAQVAEMEMRGLQQRLEAERILAQRQMESLSTTGDLTLLRVAKLFLGGDASGKLVGVGIWNPATQHGLIIAESLPPAPADHAYHVWVLDGAGGNAVRAALFSPVENTVSRVDLQPVQPLTNATEFRITAERASGVSRPRGAIIASGKL